MVNINKLTLLLLSSSILISAADDSGIIISPARKSFLVKIAGEIFANNKTSIELILNRIVSQKEELNLMPKNKDFTQQAALLIGVIPDFDSQKLLEAQAFIEGLLFGKEFCPEKVMKEFTKFFPRAGPNSKLSAFIGFVKVIEITHSVALNTFTMLGLDNLRHQIL